MSAASDDPGRGPWLAFFGCGLIWGSTFLVISIGNDTLPPMWAAAIRLALASLVLGGIAAALRHPFPRGEALKAAVLFGMFQFGVNMPLLYWGEVTVPSGIAAVLFATVPLSSSLITRAFGMERLNRLKIAGALVAIAGVAFIGGASTAGFSHTAGVLAILAAATVAGLGTTLLKRGPRQSPFAATAVGHAVGLPICLVASALVGERWSLPQTPAAWWPILYLVLAGSTGAFAMLAYLLHHWPVTRVAFISVLTPVTALILGAVVRHEPLSPKAMAGTLLVFAGLALGMTADRQAARRAAAALRADRP